jgi:hypothetical protein
MSLQGTGDLRITSLSHALRAGAKPAFASGSGGAVDYDHRLLMAVRGHLGGMPRPSSCCCRSSDQRHRTDPRPRTTPGTVTPWPSSPAPGVPPAPCPRLVLLRPLPRTRQLPKPQWRPGSVIKRALFDRFWPERTIPRRVRGRTPAHTPACSPVASPISSAAGPAEGGPPGLEGRDWAFPRTQLRRALQTPPYVGGSGPSGNVMDTGAMITFTATGPLTVKT